MAENILKKRRQILCLIFLTLTGFFIEPSRSMPYDSIFFGRSKSLSLNRFDMQDFGSGHIFYIIQNSDQMFYIMSVYRAEISDIQSFKYILMPRYQSFQTIVETEYGTFLLFGDETHFYQQTVKFVPHVVVKGQGVDTRQIMMESSDIVVDSHVVIVEDNQQVIRVSRCIIQSFKSQSSRNSGIAYHSDDLTVFFVFQVGSDRHTQCCRYRIGGMSGNECVVWAF